MIRTISLAAVVAASLLFAGCAGGGGTSSPMPQTGASLAPMASSGQTIAIRVPRPSAASASNARKPAFVSAATSSLAVTLSYAAAGNPIAYQHTFNVASDCPISNGYAVCSIALSSVATPPPATYAMSLNVLAQAFSGANGTGTLLATTMPSAGCQNAFASTNSVTCAIVLAGVVSSITVTQAAPLVVGTPGTSTVNVAEYDPSGAQLTDSSTNLLASCLAFSNVSEAFIADTAAADPNITESANHPNEAIGSIAFNGPQPSTNCFTGGGVELQFLNAPSNSYTFASNGSATLPMLRNFQVVSILGGAITNPAPIAPWSAGNGITFRPLTVPASRVAISGASGAPQTLVVPVPPGYVAPVSLTASDCLTSSAATDGTSQGTNAAASPLVSVSPASVTPASPGASVSFTVSPTGANTGTCWLTSSADATTYGAVVSW